MSSKFKGFKQVLFVSDPHKPFDHPDNDDYLLAIDKKYNPDKIVFAGDEVEHAALTMHGINPNLPSGEDEASLAKKSFQRLFKAWKYRKVDVLNSNHGSLAERQAKKAMIPRRFIKSVKEVLGAPEGWEWHGELILPLSDGSKVYCNHGISSDVGKAAAAYSMNVMQGHFHTEARIAYVRNPSGTYWGLQAGCSIDRDHEAFDYAKRNLRWQVISHALITDGQPRILLMPMDKKGRWTGKVP